MIKFNQFPGGLRKALTLSYDDGRIEDKQLISIMNTYGIKGTFHLNGGYLDSKEKVPRNEIASIYEGHEISLHSFKHPFLNAIPPEEAAFQIMEDREVLEQIAGYNVKGMSYPFGAYDEKVKSLLKSMGVVYCRTTKCTNSFYLPDDFLAWHPTCHHNQNLMEIATRFAEGKFTDSTLSVFYIYGHSFEFPRDNNWQLMDDFCKYIGGREDIWYATNMQIYGYVTALSRLEFSAKRDRVYNPSAMRLWFTKSGKSVEVAPGQTLSLS